MYMNRKGQALVEFVLILPILILILLSVIDFGNIFYSKYELQNQSVDIINLIENDTDINEIEDTYSKVNIEVNDYKDKYRKVSITKEIDVITPFLNNVIGNPYVVQIERIIPNET